MDQEQGRPLIVAVMLILMGVLVCTLTAETIFRSSQDLAKYNETEKAEYTKMFATRNKDYKDQTKEDSIQVILEFSEDNSKDANLAVMNYLSNVNGKLLSINGKSVSKNTLNPVVGGMYGAKNGLGLGIGFAPALTHQQKMFM